MTNSGDVYTAPQLDSSALITIDVQRDTLDGRALEVAGTSARLPRIKALVEAFRARGLPIVHIVRIYVADGSNVDPCRRAAVEQGASFLLAGTDGVQLAEDLLPDPSAELDSERLLAGEPQPFGPGESALYKPRWGAFYETALEDLLRAAGATTTVFCGCNFPNCPRTSIYEASERDFRVVVVRDAISGLYPQGEQELERIGASLVESKKLIAMLGTAARPAALR
jgi:nicotinamidase-related amidase